MGVFNMILVNKDKILELIPQRPPMVMIDKLLYSDNKRTETSLLIKENNIFCNNGVFCESGLIENISQTAAAGIGYLCQNNNLEVPIGYIGSIKNLKIIFLPEINTVITTEIVINNEILGFTLISGKIKTSGKIVAECEMKIFTKKK